VAFISARVARVEKLLNGFEAAFQVLGEFSVGSKDALWDEADSYA
jgi:hypothetical protein